MRYMYMYIGFFINIHEECLHALSNRAPGSILLLAVLCVVRFFGSHFGIIVILRVLYLQYSPPCTCTCTQVI